MKYIRIQSERNIEVTEGLQSIDMTNVDAHVADRLRVAPAWVQTRVMIRKGMGLYPSCIKEWDSVKALAAARVLTIGMETDECDDPAVDEVCKRIENAQRERLNRAEQARTDSIGGTRRVVRKKPDPNTEVGEIING